MGMAYMRCSCATLNLPLLIALQQGHPPGHTMFSKMQFWFFKHLPVDLHTVAANKTQQPLETGRYFACWSKPWRSLLLPWLQREPKARQPNLAFLCNCAWLMCDRAWNMRTCWQHLCHNWMHLMSISFELLVNVQIPQKYFYVINPIIYQNTSCKFVNTALRR